MTIWDLSLVALALALAGLTVVLALPPREDEPADAEPDQSPQPGGMLPNGDEDGTYLPGSSSAFGPFRRCQLRGRPRMRWAMILRWISEVPPAMVPEKLRR